MRNLLFALPFLAMTAMPQVAIAQSGQTAVGRLPPAAAQVNRPVIFSSQNTQSDGSLVLLLSSQDNLAAKSSAFDDTTRASLSAALKAADFSFASGSSLSLRGIGPWKRVLIIGMGDAPDDVAYQTAGSVAGRALTFEAGAITVNAYGTTSAQAAHIATGIGLGEYRSNLYETAGRKASITDPVTVLVDDANATQTIYAAQGQPMIKAMAWARDISNEPGNVVYPEVFVERARKAFAGIPNVKIEVLDTAAMEKLGMGALLGSARGSQRPPRILIVKYTAPGTSSTAPVVLVGKGITFDTGGISLKPNAGMADMKFDMSGAASVTGAVLSLAGSRATVNVVAVSALSENMPDAAAIRPGDILRAMNGRTIEIGSTDAEGRLVLADAISWVDKELAPAAIVDVATLTGAIITALGDDYAGLFSRNDDLSRQIEVASKATGELVWRMPLHASYAKYLASDYADIKNNGSGPGGGLGAHFIGEFVKPQTPWAHLDIAGVAWAKANDTRPSGSTAWGLQLLDTFVRDFTPASVTEKTAERP